MIKLTQILKELLIKEVDENTTLYHRSPIKLNPGDIIKPNKDASGHHWMESKPAEIGMEHYRKQMNPSAPSRFDCVYSSLIPRSRFVDKGYLYEIKPKGKIHITDSSLIDEINERFERDSYDDLGSYDEIQKAAKKDPVRVAIYLPYYEVKDYWDGVSPTKTNLKNIEVLSDSALVVREVQESEKATPFVVGDTIKVSESNKIRIKSNIYINSNEYGGKEKPHMTSEEIDGLIEDLKTQILDSNATISREDEDWSGQKYTVLNIDGTLKKGAKFIVSAIRHQMQRAAAFDFEPRGKYSKLNIDPIVNDKPIHSDGKKNEYAIYSRIEVNSSWNKDIPNFADYLKKV